MAQGSGESDIDRTRLFVACYPPTQALDHARAWIAPRLPSVARLTSPERWHVTVAFLGNVPRSRIASLADQLRALAPRDLGPLTFTGAAHFGRSIVALGVSGSSDVLTSVARDHRRVSHACAAAGARPERGRWHPHLTVARARNGSAADVAQALTGYRGTPWWWRDVRLVESRLGPHPEHITLLQLAL